MVYPDVVCGYIRATHLTGNTYDALDNMVECSGEDGLTHGVDAHGWVGFFTHLGDWDPADVTPHLTAARTARLAKDTPSDPVWTMDAMVAEVEKVAAALAALPAGHYDDPREDSWHHEEQDDMPWTDAYTHQADEADAVAPEPPADAEIIHAYTRAQEIEDSALIAVDRATARRAGLRHPVAITANAWTAAVAWDEGNGVYQDEPSRLLELLTTCAQWTRGHREQQTSVEYWRIPNRPIVDDDADEIAEPVTVIVHCGPGDTPDPVITIMMPGDD